MAFQLDVENLALVQSTDRLGHMITAMVDALVARGWTIEGSGDGLSAFENRTQTAGPYDVFTSGLGYYTGAGPWSASLGGANSISNARAWIIVKEPAPSARALMIQRSSSGSVGFECFGNMEFSMGGFATSGATATSPPAAVGSTNATMLGTRNGTGTDLLGSNAVEIGDAVTLIFNFLVSDVARAGDVWPLRFTVYNSTTATRTAAMVYESLVETVPGDAHPLLIGVGSWTNILGAPSTTPSMTYWGTRDTGALVSTLGFWYSTLVTFGSAPSGGSPVLANGDGKIRPLPIYVGVTTTAQGYYKGRCEYLQYNYQARNYPSTLDVATATPYVYAGLLLLNWKTSVTPGT